MLNTLRSRLILSHVLPLAVIIPLMGLVLVYTLETKVLLVNLSKDLEAQAVLFAEIADDYASMWQDPDHAQAFVTRFSPHLAEEVALLSPDGFLLASSDPADAEGLGQPFEPFRRADLMAGHLSVETSYSRQQLAEIIQVSIPVMSPGQRVLGVIRLSHRLSGVYDWFRDLRAVSITVLAAGLLLGSASGLILARSIERPLRQVTQAIFRLSSGRKLTPLPAQGAREIQLLASAFNSLFERLQSLEQARRQLLANLVHELRRPLGALYSAMEALIGGAGEDAELRLELLEGMEEQVERLQRLLGDLAQLHDQVLGTLELRSPACTAEHLALACAGALAGNRTHGGVELGNADSLRLADAGGGPRPPDTGRGQSTEQCGQIHAGRRFGVCHCWCDRGSGLDPGQ